MENRQALQAMRYVLAIWEKKSFTQAAVSLGLTQPALTQAVKKTEETLGVSLFSRTKKTLELSEAGRIYLAKAKAIAALEGELTREISDLTELRAGTLTVGGTHFLNAYVLPSAIAAFRLQYPAVDLKLLDAGADELLRMLQDGRIDLTFSCEAFATVDFKRTFAFEDRLLLAVPKRFELASQLQHAALSAREVTAKRHQRGECPEVTLKDFAAFPFVLLTKENNLYRRSIAMFEKEGFKPKVLFQAGQLVTAARLAEAGLGVTFVSDRLVGGREESVFFFKLKNPQTERRFDAVTLKSRYESKAQTAFSELVANLC